MKQTPLVLIGIQARSSSTRLPNKVHLKLGDKPILRHVLDSANYAAQYLNRKFAKHPYYGFETKVAILCPVGDSIVDKYSQFSTVYAGDEKDVLSRYVSAARLSGAELIVRVTADCAFTQSHIISTCIKTARITQSDYTSNTLIRTFPEGWDTEVLSLRLLEWLNTNALQASDREHVTSAVTHCYKKGLFPFKSDDGKSSISHVLNELDLSAMRTSIDTLEDYEKAKELVETMRDKINEARASGKVRLRD
jgi:spore coat polysaccharide biosynthesis protein SpsF